MASPSVFCTPKFSDIIGRHRGSMQFYRGLPHACSHERSISFQEFGNRSINVSKENIKTLKYYDHNLEVARSMLLEAKEPKSAMAVVDLFQHLGIDYHFEEEVKSITQSLCEKFSSKNRLEVSLHDMALYFRLLRQEGCYVSSDTFKRFMNKEGNFEVSLCHDIKGLMSLYEASHVDTGEEILCKAHEFSIKYLKASKRYLEDNANKKIKRTLENPIYKSLQRFEARQFISEYKGNIGASKVLKELAIMDFNKVQSLHRSELSQVLRWWEQLALSKEAPFFRAQPTKWYMWSMAIIPEPQVTCRIELTKVIALVYLIDDIFDVFGSLEELTLFTEAVERWDISMMDSLPTYMKICFHSLQSITKEISDLVLKKHGWDPINLLRKSWALQFKAILVEAKWSASRTTPPADKHLENGVITTGVHLVLIHLLFILCNGEGKEVIARHLENNQIPDFISHTSLILRLWDDLGTVDERQEGYDGSYVEYYMKEHDETLENAKYHTVNMISSAWKKLNRSLLLLSPENDDDIKLPLSLKKAALNVARMIRPMYSYQDHRLPLLEDYARLMLLQQIS